MPAMEELNERFRADRFAAQAGVEIREAEPGRALCAMPLRPCHMNANGAPMGGAIFTLADFAYARSEERRVGKECRSRGLPDH